MQPTTHALHCLNGEYTGQVFAIEGQLVVGRSTNCGLFVPDRRMSRRHARFYPEGQNLFVEDLDSHNGTFVNGKRIARMQLFSGDVVRVGTSQFEVDIAKLQDSGVVQLIGDGASMTAHLVKPVNPEDAPNLGRMGVDDYFEALGLFDSGKHHVADSAQIEILAQQTRNFAILHEISRTVQQYDDLDAMLAAVMDLVLKVNKADRAFIVLVDEDESLVPRIVRYRDTTTVPSEPERVAMSATVAEQVLTNRCGIITSDALTDDRFSSAESVVLNDIRSLLAVPIIVGSRVLGLIELENNHKVTGFNENDLDLLSIVASVIGQAIENLTLAHQREQTIAKLKEAQDQLLQAQDRLVKNEQIAIIGRLSSGIAHEVKNHLSPFMLADMIARSYPDDDEIQEASELMLEAHRRILGLVSEISHFATGSKAEYQIGTHDMSRVMEGVVRFVRCDARVKACDLKLIIRDRPVVDMDANRFRQVIINLVRNAADAVVPGQGVIRVRMREQDGYVVVEVEDNGQGIRAEDGEHLFEPFFTTKGEKGLGLGLDISRNIIVSHGGSLTFESKVGEGTTFRIVMPLVQPMPDEDAPPPS